MTFLEPRTKRRYEQKSKRVYFKRRDNMLSKAIIILNFDGIVGYNKKTLADFSPFYLRPGVA